MDDFGSMSGKNCELAGKMALRIDAIRGSRLMTKESAHLPSMLIDTDLEDVIPFGDGGDGFI